MENKYLKYLYTMQKWIIPILLIAIVILLVTKRPKEIIVTEDKGWKETQKLLEQKYKEQEKLYKELSTRNKKETDSLNRIIFIQERNFLKQVSDLKKKYEKEYIRVTNTPIDTTVIISTKFLSEEIDYSKFQE